MDVVEQVNRVDGQDHLSQVELGHLLWKSVLKLTEQSQEVPTHIVVHDQVLEKRQNINHWWLKVQNQQNTRINLHKKKLVLGFYFYFITVPTKSELAAKQFHF